MDKRENLKKLVLITIPLKNDAPSAREIYDDIKYNPIINKEHVRGFRSFVRIINSFPEIETKGYKGKNSVYFIKQI
jgi:hypothetical protein